MARFAVILAAAGQSSRFGAKTPREKKVFQELKGRAVWLRSAEAFQNRDDVVQTLLVVSPDDLDWFKEKFQPNLAFMDIEVVAGGAERADSVQNALARVGSDVDFVAVHDAARPLIAKAWIDDIFAAAIETGAAIPGTPISSTVKKVADGVIEKTVPRTGLYAAQTPQVVRRELLLEAYAQRGSKPATDEASLVEHLGHPVMLVEGSQLNIKITTKSDLQIASAFLELLPKEKTLETLHPFADDGLDWLKKS
ncbi:MAG: 2-C-methyl-D-erythritol 4-phosphate cytidylyltransferase [Planctomycetota bacterium]|jgi:2-C-methyl-D-erythritol 4-phosphate cytidylyltransferase